MLGALTVSNDPLVRILSVVAATLPPFCCKSQIIALRSTCGNITAICSTSAESAIRGLPLAVVSEDLEKKRYRIVKAMNAARRSREGIESVCC